MTEIAIHTESLTKRFGAFTAVEDLSLEVKDGTVVSLLGPNGAGKTTTVRMLATLLRPDAGRARVGGHDVVTDAARVRELISLTGQFAALDKNLTARENLVLMARLRGRNLRAARRARRSSSSIASTSATSATAWSRTSPAARSGASTWPPASSTPRTCSSWTSPPRGSIPAAVRWCGRRSASSSRTGSRFCSPPSTWRRPTRWPTAWS